MTETEITILQEKLNKEKAFAFSEETPHAPTLSDIVSQLNAIEDSDKPSFYDFVYNLKADLFSKSVNIKGLNLSDFTNNSQPEIQQSEEVLNEKIENQVNLAFIDLYKELVGNINEHFDVYKGYFILKLENDPLKTYKLLVLYDKSFIIEPIKKKIIKSISTETTFKNISDFLEDVTKVDNSDKNFLCLLLLMPRINNSESGNELIGNLNTLISNFKYFENISLKYLSGNIQNDYHHSIDKEEFIEEVKFINFTLLSNASIKHEEEKIVKKLTSCFKTPLVLYKTLKSGNSGSKVIEIRPKKELGIQYERRYVIKYTAIDSERKIKKEKENFDEFIRGYKVNGYSCDFQKTLTHEGIMYEYAVADSEQESFSFSEILSNENNQFFHDKADLIDNLFDDLDLYTTWSNIVEKKKFKVCDLYSDYINKEKIFSQIRLILNIDEVELIENELVKNFNLLWNYEDEFNIKICHGDLHSDNFFKDKKGIYLIDFGFTGKKHSIIDHSSLECSIKFKHFPSFIEISELMDIEEELILDSSFQRSTRFTKTTRPNLIQLLELIKNIRNNAMKQSYMKSKDDYLLSLFIMTFRQIRYKDLNQLYAYNSALVLSRKLIQTLNINITS